MIKPEKPYCLIGQDGNAYALMNYTAKAMKTAGFRDQVSQMYSEATKGTYEDLLVELSKYIDIVNKHFGFSKKRWGELWEKASPEYRYWDEWDDDDDENEIDLSDDDYDDEWDDDENEIDLSDDED